MVLVEGCASELMTFLWRAWTRCEIRLANWIGSYERLNGNFISALRMQSTKYQLTDKAIRDYVRIKPKLVNYYYYPTRIFMIMFDIYGIHM